MLNHQQRRRGAPASGALASGAPVFNRWRRSGAPVFNRWMRTLSWPVLGVLALALVLAFPPAPTWANDNPVLGTGEPTTTSDPPPPPDPPCHSPPCDPCKGGGSPVYVVSGTMFRSFVDLDYLLTRRSFSIIRSYTSDDFYIGLFGRGFHSTLDMMAIPTFKGQLPDEIVVIRWPNGQRYKFTKQPDGTYSAPLGRSEELVKVPGGYEVRTPSGLVYAFDEDTKLLSIADATGTDVTLTHDDRGRPATLILTNGPQITVTYNANGFVDTLSDSAGRATSYGYNEDGFLTEFTDALGNTWNYEHDPAREGLDSRIALLARVVDPHGQTLFSVEYDDQDRVSRMVDFDGDYTYAYLSASLTRKTDNITGAHTDYYFDATGVITRVVAPGGGQSYLYYDSTFRLTRRTDADGYSTNYTYDDAGRLLTVTDPLSNTTSHTYNTEGRVETVTDPFSRVTRYEYDASGNRTRVIENADAPLERATQYAYDAAGRQTSVTDFAGSETSFEYDAAGNRTRQVDALGNATTFEYDALGRLTSNTNPLGNVTSWAYDVLGNETGVTDSLDDTTVSTYDAMGRLDVLENPEGETTDYDYDAYGRVTQITDALSASTNYNYDSHGRLTSLVDANSNETLYEYDLPGRLTRETNPLSDSTQYTYSPGGRRTSATDANANATAFLYDGLGRVTQITYPGGTFEATAYHGHTSLPASLTDRNGNTTTFEYDALNRLTSKQYADGTTARYSYDASDNMLIAQTSNPQVILSFQYDALGRLTSESNIMWGKTVTYAYDAAGRRTSMTNPQSQTTAYAYDAAGQLTRISHPTMGTVDYTYDGADRRLDRTMPNGSHTAYAYDGAGHRTQIEHRKDDDTLLTAYDYTVDAVGNRLTMTDGDGLHTYEYDAASQITAITHPNPGANPNESYSYGPGRNRTASHLSAGHAYDGNNRLLQDDDFTYSYDANGNLTRKTARVGGDVTDYAYDAENRLVEAELPDGSLMTYIYDALGRRVEKNVSGAITRYVYAGENIVSEYSASLAVQAIYLHGPVIDEPLAQRRGSTNYYYHTDALGSVRMLTDSAQGVAATYTYDAYGQIQQQTGAVENPYAFTAREWDAETELYHYRARAYSPSIGRFLQVDPTASLLGLHQYAYVENNPLNRTDPFGLKPGDKYTTQDGAAIAASNDINNTSITEGAEYAGWIYKNSDGTYSYTAPNKGTKDGSSPGAKPAGGTAYYHTHGANDAGYDNENFSKPDKDFAEGGKVDGYVATPAGDIKKYDHKTKKPSKIGSTNSGGGGTGTGGAVGGGAKAGGAGGKTAGGSGPGGGSPCPCGGSG